MNRVWVPLINRKRCTACGHCAAGCPTGALGLVEGQAVIVQPELCTYCGVCEEICPNGAIELPYEIGFSQNYQGDET